AVGWAGAAQKILAVLRSGKRQSPPVGTLIRAHRENADQWAAVTVFSFEMAIEEAQLHAVYIRRDRSRLVTEVDCTHEILEWHRVTPRTDHEPLSRASALRSAACTHAGKVANRPTLKDVVPAANVKRGHPDLGVALFDRQVAPEIVERGMLEPVEEVRCSRAEHRELLERHMFGRFQD